MNTTDPENPESIPPRKWKRDQLEEVPVPELILFALTELRGLPRYGPHEKLRWAVDGTFRGVLFSVRLEKFGLHLYVPEDTPDTLPAELIKYLERGTRIADASGTSGEAVSHYVHEHPEHNDFVAVSSISVGFRQGVVEAFEVWKTTTN